jgi:putative sigma-54 modulation protein
MTDALAALSVDRRSGTPWNFPVEFCAITAHALCMNLIIVPHNVTLTKAIEDHLISRVDKLDHLNHYATHIRVTLDHDRTKAAARQFSCAIRVELPGPDLFARDVEADLYAAIDLVAKKIEQQLRKRQSKYKARKHRVASRTKRSRQEAAL